MAGLRNDTSQLQFSAAVQPGNSGGPLLDASGAVTGIVVAKLDAIAVASAIGDIPQNVNFAIKGEVAAVFLRTHGIEPTFAAIGAPPVAVPDAVENARQFTFVIECDPLRPTAKQRADAQRTADETRAVELRRTADAEEARRKREADEEERRSELRKTDEYAAQLWTKYDRRIFECVQPVGVAHDVWTKMGLSQRWTACDAAGTIRPQVRVTESGFFREEPELSKLQAGLYRNLPLAARGRWLSMYAFAEGLSLDDVIEVSLTSPTKNILTSNTVKLRPGQTGATYVWIGKRQAIWSSWSPGQYTARIRVKRNGTEMLDFSASVEIRDTRE